MALDDYDYPDDDYVDPLDQVDGHTRNRILAQQDLKEEAAKHKWGFWKNTLWYIAFILGYVWGGILVLLGAFCCITIVLIPVAPFFFAFAAIPLTLLIQARVRNRIACTIPTEPW